MRRLRTSGCQFDSLELILFSQAFTTILKKQGIKFRLSTKVVGAEVNGTEATLTVEPAKGGAQEKLTADSVLVSIGRRPFTSNLGLDSMGIKTDKRGFVLIDDNFRTNIPNIYAIGDVVRGPMLAHKAEEEGIAIAENLAGRHGHVNYNNIPSVIYTTPEVAWTGKNEEVELYRNVPLTRS